MAASVTIVERTQAGGSETDKTSGQIRFKNADDTTVDSNNPMVIPTAGADWSFEKWLRLNLGATAPSDKIDNINFYSDGANGFGTGVNVWARSISAFSTPAELTTSTGLVDLFGLTSAAPLSISSGTFSSTGTHMGSHVVLAMEVSFEATVGALTAETITFSYDEI